jgi:hypothetical protein
MPLPCWFDRRGSKQHRPGPITGPQRLVVNQWQHEWLLAEQERQEAHVKRKGSIELLFAWFVAKLAEDLLIGFVKFGGSLALGDARGHQSSKKKSGLDDKLVSVFDQDMCRAPGSSSTTSLLLASGCLLKTGSASQTTGSLQRKNGTWTSGTLLATTGAVSLTMSLADKMQQGSIVSTKHK